MARTGSTMIMVTISRLAPIDGEGVAAGQGAEEDGDAAEGQEVDDGDGVDAAAERVRLGRRRG